MRIRIFGLDYVRAVMSVLVVIWHMGGDAGSLFFKYYLLGIAVPSFMLVSNYLFARKHPTSEDLSRQIKRILLLLGFWPIIFILYTKTGILGPVDLLPHSPGAVVVFLLRGGNTIYYFFVCLLFTLLLTFFLSKLKTSSVVCAFVAACTLLYTIPLMDNANMFGTYKLSYYWNPTNFLAYPPAAILVLHIYNRIDSDIKKYLGSIVALLSLSGFFALLEWNYYVDPDALRAGMIGIPIYTRVSVVLLSIFILITALNKKIPPSRTISYMSRHSLALYCLHPFLMGPVKKLISEILPSMPEMITLYISISVVILFSYLLSVLLGTFLKKEFIR